MPNHETVKEQAKKLLLNENNHPAMLILDCQDQHIEYVYLPFKTDRSEKFAMPGISVPKFVEYLFFISKDIGFRLSIQDIRRVYLIVQGLAYDNDNRTKEVLTIHEFLNFENVVEHREQCHNLSVYDIIRFGENNSGIDLLLAIDKEPTISPFFDAFYMGMKAGKVDALGVCLLFLQVKKICEIYERILDNEHA